MTAACVLAIAHSASAGQISSDTRCLINESSLQGSQMKKAELLNNTGTALQGNDCCSCGFMRIEVYKWLSPQMVASIRPWSQQANMTKHHHWFQTQRHLPRQLGDRSKCRREGQHILAQPYYQVISMSQSMCATAGQMVGLRQQRGGGGVTH